MPVSIRQARDWPGLVRHSIALDGAVAELCAYPEVREEKLHIVEEQAILMLGLSRPLAGSRGRVAGDPRRRFSRFGGLALRPAGVPLDIHVGQGAFHTVRIRFDARRIAPVLGDMPMDDALLAACLDIDAPAIAEAMLRLAAELDHPVADSPALAEALVSLMLLDLGRHLRSAAERGRRRQGGLSARALGTALAMMEAPGPPPSIDAIAARCGLSRHHFIRCFRESTGSSPGTALRRLLIERAKALLVEEDWAIDTVARRLGYAGAPSFCTAFRRATGRSPAQWRALMH